MEYPDSTPEYIRDFLKGRLTAAEAKAFQQRMANDPALENEVALACILLGGLEEINRQQRRRRQWQKRIWIGTDLFVCAILIGIIITGISPPVIKSPPPLIGVSVAWNEHGEVVAGGQYRGTRMLGAFPLDSFGKQDLFVARCDTFGQILWRKTFGSAGGNDYLTKIALDGEGNTILTGGLFDSAFFGNRLVRAVGKANSGEGDFFVAKLNASGDVIWLDHSGGVMIPNKQTGVNMGTAVTVDRENNVIATGMYIGSPVLGHITLPVGGPIEDLYLAKYDNDGNLLWAAAATCDYNIYANSIATDPEANIYLTGFFGHHNLGGKAYFENITLQSYGGRDIFIAKYDPFGKLLWVKQAGAPNRNSQDSGRGIISDGSGNCYVTGWFEGTPVFADTLEHPIGKRDAFLAKYDANGNLLWVRTMGGQQNDQGNSVCLDAEGNIYCAGHFSGTAIFGSRNLKSRGDNDVFIAKYNKDGVFQWAKHAGSSDSEWQMDSAHDLAPGPNGWLVFTGMFSGQEVFFEEIPIACKGEKGVFLVYFDKDGNVKKIELLPV